MYRYEQDARKVLRIPEGQSGRNVMAYCPFHDNTGTPSLRIDLQSGLWLCFVCEMTAKGGLRKSLGGNIASLYRRLGKDYGGDVDIEDMSRRLELLKHETLYYDGTQDRALKTITRKRAERMQKSYEVLADVAVDWLQSERDITPETSKAFQCGYDAMMDAVTIPWRTMSGSLIGHILRFIDADALGPKYKNPKRVQKKEHLFGVHLCKGDRPLVVVEGPLDVLKVYDAVFTTHDVVGQLGSSMSSRQAEMILDLQPTRVITMYDGDKAGAKAQEFAKQELHGVFTTHLRLPQGSDPGSLSAQRIRNMLASD